MGSEIDFRLLQRWPDVSAQIELACELRRVGGTFLLAHGYGRSAMPFVHICNPEVLEVTDETPAVVLGKFAEFLMSGGVATPIFTVGQDGRKRVLGYPGAIREWLLGEEYYAAGFSGLPGFHDTVLALAGLHFEFHVHHVGVRYATEEEYTAAVAQLQEEHRYWVCADTPKGPDHHLRHFGGVYALSRLVGMREVQYFPYDSMAHKREEHLDVAVSATPQDVARLILLHLEKVPGLTTVFEDWGGNGPGPVCMVGAVDPKRDFQFVLHLRHLQNEHWVPDGIPWNE